MELAIIVIVLAIVLAVAQRARAKGLSQPIQLPKIIYGPGGASTIIPAPGTMPVTPIPGAAPVQPKPVTLPPEVPISQDGQVIILNSNTGMVASTSLGNLPDVYAGGWRTIIIYSSYDQAKVNRNASYPYVAWKDGYGYFTVTAKEASAISGGE